LLLQMPALLPCDQDLQSLGWQVQILRMPRRFSGRAPSRAAPGRAGAPRAGRPRQW
jgi:hypothetical protein